MTEPDAEATAVRDLERARRGLDARTVGDRQVEAALVAVMRAGALNRARALDVLDAVRQASTGGPAFEAWTELLEAELARPQDSTRVLAAAERLVEVGRPSLACHGLATTLRLLRTAGARALGEVVALARLAVLDREAGAAPLSLPHEADGREAAAAAVRAAWPFVCRLDTSGLADHVEQGLSSGVLSLPGDPLADRGLDVLLRALRAPAGDGAPDAGWLRARFVRGLSFAVPALGEQRFWAYDRYALQRGLSSADHMRLWERWAQALTLRGDFALAVQVLGDGLALLPQDAAAARVVGLRGLARCWRMAGDAERALNYNDQALTLLAEPGIGASARGNTWLNRAAVLLELGRPVEANEAARRSRQEFDSDSTLRTGQAESAAMVCLTEPDTRAAAELAEQLLDMQAAGRLPHPVQVSSLNRAASALARTDPARAAEVYRTAASLAVGGRRHRVLLLMDLVRLLLAHPDLTSPTEVMVWAAEAAAAAEAQSSQLLVARTRLLLARCQAQAGDDTAAAATASAGLDHALGVLVTLTAAGGERVLMSARDDLLVLFDAAVRAGDGLLAARLVEVGRGLRLASVLRLQPELLPEEVRTAFAQAVAAERAVDDLEASPDEPADAPDVRTAATDARDSSHRRLEEVCGRVLSGVATGDARGPQAWREAFPRTHLVSLTEDGGVLRWTWWPPEAERPRCGRRRLDHPRLRALLDAYERGTARTAGGDVVTPLLALLPDGLAAALADAEEPQELLICPTGRLWHIPYAAIPLRSGRRLVHAARLFMTPSFALAVQLAERQLPVAVPTPRDDVYTYCNPALPGAALERAVLQQQWRARELEGVRQFGLPEPGSLAVVATHADRAPGLAQSLRDHRGERLSAGECIMRRFPTTVVLGTCHADGTSSETGDPVGLLTVVAARGATWTAGGYQSVDDRSSAWIMVRVYRSLSEGRGLGEALRSAQLEYLDLIAGCVSGGGAVPEELRATRPVSASTMLQPWYWSFAVTGPPQAV